MHKILSALTLLAALFVSPAYADFTGKDASAATITFKNPGTCTSVVCVPVFQLYDGTNVVTLTTSGADGVSNTLTGLPAYARNLVFNGTTWDRWQGAVTNAGTFATQSAVTAASGSYSSGAFASGAYASGSIASGAYASGSIGSGAFASGSIGSGAIASGAVASGAVASGAVASGAYASGSIASGAMVDLGSQADSAAAGDTSTASLIALLKRNNQNLTTLNTTAGNPLATGAPAGSVGLNATPSLANGNGVVPTQGGSVLSATNGQYSNILQGNAVLSATNPSFASITDGTNKAAVTAASTAPVATNPALVVTKSPNSPDVPFAAYSTASITRSANTTTYTANTGWNNGTPTFFSFTAACRVNGGQVLIPRIDIWSSANPTLKLTGVLWLFSAVPGTNVSDDATFTIASADFANLTGSLGGFAFSLGNNQASGASNSSTSLVGTTYQMQCASGTTTITGMVEVTDAYVPANAEVLHVGVATVGAN